MQIGGCLRTVAARPCTLGEMSVILKLPRSAGCYLRAAWSTNSVNWVQQEPLVRELQLVSSTVQAWETSVAIMK